MATPESNPASAVRGVVLLVDDEASLRRALARKLRADGHEVLEADTASSALETLSAQDVDLVVSDITMPDMGGVELLRLARDRKPDVPVLLMTGAPDIGTAVKAVEYGAFEYLTKPFDLERLSESVARAVRRHRKAVADRQIVDSAVRSKNLGSAPRVSGGQAITSGTLLGGRYRIVRLLGAGGMGTVYEAEREDLANMPVAIKVLHAKLADRGDLVQRFRREAELVATIRHANIVGILDFVSADEEPTFIVMELLRGCTLGQAIQRDPPFSERRVAFVASQVLDALAGAHGMNVIHRDLKPDNVFLTALSDIADVVKLLDFGVAKLLSEDAELRLTQTGTVLGTPAYMAPEYARGEPASVLGDLYAVGCVMYEALTRTQPFSGANYNALLFAIQQQAPQPIRTLRRDVSVELAEIVERAMSKDPSARFESAVAMRKALEPWLARAASASRSQLPSLESAPTEELPRSSRR